MAKAKKKKKTYRLFRHRVVFAVVKPLARIFIRLKCGWRKPIKPKGTPKFKQYVVLANHNNDFDTPGLATAIPGPCQFVASDHILKWKVGRLINWACGPIAISRAQLDLKAIKEILQCKKEGGSIGIFPEGGCTYTGRTGYIAPATAKLVKQLGLPVYLYGIEGSFLMKPIAAKNMRKGREWCVLRKTLTAEEVAAMSVNELHECICENLHVDAYATQREKMYKYKGKDLAAELEVSLYRCPKCGAMCQMHGEGNTFSCKACGYSLKYNVYGFFEGEDVIFDNITDWDDWQRKEIVRCIEEGEYDLTGKTPIFVDEDEIFIESEKAHEKATAGKGTFYMYSDRFELHGDGIDQVWYFDKIEKLRATNRSHLSFSVGGETYIDLKSERVRSSYKYMLNYNALKLWAKGKPIDFFGV